MPLVQSSFKTHRNVSHSCWANLCALILVRMIKALFFTFSFSLVVRSSSALLNPATSKSRRKYSAKNKNISVLHVMPRYSALDGGRSNLGSSPGQANCVEFLGKALYSQCFLNGGWLKAMWNVFPQKRLPRKRRSKSRSGRGQKGAKARAGGGGGRRNRKRRKPTREAGVGGGWRGCLLNSVWCWE